MTRLFFLSTYHNYPPNLTQLLLALRFTVQDWCNRKQFKDGDLVTREKYLDYITELIFPQVHHSKDDPRLSVLPLRINATTRHEGDLPGRVKVNGHKSAVRYLYIEQCIRDGVTPNIKGVLKNRDIQAITEIFNERFV